MERDQHDELRALLAEARAFLSWERDLGGVGIPSARSIRKGEVVTRATSVLEPEPGRVPPMAARSETALERPAPDVAVRRLALLAEEAERCSACRLHTHRSRSVFARGSFAADLAFVGEGPGQQEDEQGVPFVGPAGQLLDKMIAAMGYGRDDVYVCNVVKCRPPENRTPEADEANACSPFLSAQLGIVRPRVIVALGRCAAEGLGVMPSDGRGWRGRWASWQGITVMPTYHPAYLLRSPEQKRVVWEDLQKVMAVLGRPGAR